MLPVDSAVLDGEAVVMRPDNTSDFDCGREGQAEAILVAYDIMEADGQDVRPEPLEERRKRLSKLLSRSNKTMRDGIQVSEAITGDGAAIFRHACWMDLHHAVQIYRSHPESAMPTKHIVTTSVSEMSGLLKGEFSIWVGWDGVRSKT